MNNFYWTESDHHLDIFLMAQNGDSIFQLFGVRGRGNLPPIYYIICKNNKYDIFILFKPDMYFSADTAKADIEEFILNFEKYKKLQAFL